MPAIRYPAVYHRHCHRTPQPTEITTWYLCSGDCEREPRIRGRTRRLYSIPGPSSVFRACNSFPCRRLQPRRGTQTRTKSRSRIGSAKREDNFVIGNVMSENNTILLLSKNNISVYQLNLLSVPPQNSFLRIEYVKAHLSLLKFLIPIILQNCHTHTHTQSCYFIFYRLLKIIRRI